MVVSLIHSNNDLLILDTKNKRIYFETSLETLEPLVLHCLYLASIRYYTRVDQPIEADDTDIREELQRDGVPPHHQALS